MRRDDDICHNDTTTRFNETLRFNEQRTTGLSCRCGGQDAQVRGQGAQVRGQGAQVEHVDGSVDFSGFGSRCSRNYEAEPFGGR